MTAKLLGRKQEKLDENRRRNEEADSLLIGMCLRKVFDWTTITSLAASGCHSLRFRSCASRCSRGQIDVCTKMTTPSPLVTLRGKIDALEAEILDTKKTLAEAQAPADITFWRQQLGDLNKEKIILREQETILLRGQMSGGH